MDEKKLSDIKNNVSTEKELGEAWRFLIVFNEIFDFINIQNEEIPENIKNILERRSEARNIKNWELSDKYRKELLDLGWVIIDTKNGQILRKK